MLFINNTNMYFNIVYFTGLDTELDTFKLEQLSLDQRNVIEADSFWCLSKFLDCIQDNYIFAQLGIQTKVNQLKELIQRIDGEFLFYFLAILNNRFLIISNFCRPFYNSSSRITWQTCFWANSWSRLVLYIDFTNCFCQSSPHIHRQITGSPC